MTECRYEVYHNITNGGLEGAQQALPPKKKLSTVILIPFCIIILKHKAQIARESIKNPESFQGPTPAVRDFGLPARDVRARK